MIPFVLATLLTLPTPPVAVPQRNRLLHDRLFWTAVVPAAGFTYLDAYTTSHAPGRLEESGMPWLYGNRPSNGRAFGIMTGELLLESLAAWRLKNSSGFLRHWWMVPLVVGGIEHGHAGISNLGLRYPTR